MIKNKTRQKAEEMRTDGKSYADISRELGVAKSTLSYWFSATSNYLGTSEKQLEHLRRTRILAIKAIHKKNVDKQKSLEEKVSLDFSNQNKDSNFTKKIALSMLYWAEGTKHKKSRWSHFYQY